jgi:hypothetical protein
MQKLSEQNIAWPFFNIDINRYVLSFSNEVFKLLENKERVKQSESQYISNNNEYLKYSKEWYIQEKNKENIKWTEVIFSHESIKWIIAWKLPHEILWISEDSTLAEAKKAYKKLAKLCHPDRVKWEIEQFFEKWDIFSSDFIEEITLFSVKTEEEINNLSPEEKKNYFKKQYNKCNNDELNEIILTEANKKMHILNLAYQLFKEWKSIKTILWADLQWEEYEEWWYEIKNPNDDSDFIIDDEEFFEEKSLIREITFSNLAKIQYTIENIWRPDQYTTFPNLLLWHRENTHCKSWSEVIISVKTFIAFLDFIEWKEINEILLQDIISSLNLDDKQTLEVINLIQKREKIKDIINKIYWEKKYLDDWNDEDREEMYHILKELYYWPVQFNEQNPEYDNKILLEKDTSWNIIINLKSYNNSINWEIQEIFLTQENLEVIKTVAYWLPIDSKKIYLLN